MFECPFTILIDSAEQHPFDFRNLKADSAQDYQMYTIHSRIQCLGRHPDSLGDYSLEGGEGRCHIERKSMEDLQSTLLGFEDGHRERFESEMENLSKIEAPLLVVECNKLEFLQNAPEYGIKTRQENAKILYRSLISIQQRFRVQIEWSGSRQMAQQDTFRWMYRFWEKNLKPRRKRKSDLQQPQLPLNTTTEAQQLLQSI